MPDTIPMVDVIQLGYGPVSEVMALALARQGHTVAVVERWRERYPLPRAVCVDHEIYRVLCALGLQAQLPAVTHPGPWYRWFNAEWKELLAIDWSSESISGGPEVNFVHQPTLESMFDDAVRGCANVSLHLGCEAVEVLQTETHAEVVMRDVETGALRRLRGRYVIGADGANSLVRRTIGGAQQDRGFEADWLVIDVLPHEGVQLDIPPAAQYCNPARPTTIVPAGVKDGRYFRRWEFMRLPHESRDELEQEDRAWQLLGPWVRRDQATIVRHKVYTFRSLLAEQWRSGRLLIAGDAAHVMPPFMGQGLCAGVRDAWNLAWKLDRVLRGEADPRLLDTYQPERGPHVSDVIDISMFLGRIICIPDAQKAAERDAAFFSGQVPPPPPFPHLTDGLLQRDRDGTPARHAGLLSPHGRIEVNGHVLRFDEATGGGFVLVSCAPQGVAAGHRAALQRIGGMSVELCETHSPRAGAWRDLDDKFLPYMRQHGIDVMLVRPDFYLYGAAAGAAAADALVRDCLADLARHGVRVDAAAPEAAHP